MLALAGEAGGIGTVKRCSRCCRSLVSPAEHVGEHHGGRLGWRAWGLSGCGRTNTTGCGLLGELRGTLLQADAAALSSHSIVNRARCHALRFSLGFMSMLQLVVQCGARVRVLLQCHVSLLHLALQRLTASAAAGAAQVEQ